MHFCASAMSSQSVAVTEFKNVAAKETQKVTLRPIPKRLVNWQMCCAPRSEDLAAEFLLGGANNTLMVTSWTLDELLKHTSMVNAGSF